MRPCAAAAAVAAAAVAAAAAAAAASARAVAGGVLETGAGGALVPEGGNGVAVVAISGARAGGGKGAEGVTSSRMNRQGCGDSGVMMARERAVRVERNAKGRGACVGAVVRGTGGGGGSEARTPQGAFGSCIDERPALQPKLGRQAGTP